jgi:hypothetical protein
MTRYIGGQLPRTARAIDLAIGERTDGFPGCRQPTGRTSTAPSEG